MFGLKLGLPRPTDPDKTPSQDAATPASGLSPIASAVVLAAGAGVAFWWWTQWARGRAESEADVSEGDTTQADGDAPKAVE
jgi:uncharacterized protein HemX